MQFRRISQRQANLALIGAQAALCVVVGLVSLLLNLGTVMIAGSLIGLVLYLGLLLAYKKNQEWARYATVAATTALTGAVIVLDHHVAVGFSPAFFVPSILALILADPLMIGLSGLAMLLIAALGIGAPNPYLEPVRLVMIIIVIGGAALARAVLDSERSQREEAAERAHEAQHRAETETATAQRQSAELAMQAEEQRRLFDLVGELETPTVPLSDGVLLAPIIGALDGRRLRRLSEKLLADVAGHRTQLLMLDLAGVSLLDTQAAAALSNIVAGVRLLGCKVVLTGITAQSAITLTQLGVGFAGVATARSPQEALAQHLQVVARTARN